MKIKKGDKVKVISGKDKGKSGLVLRALPKEDKVVVEGVAVVKRHLRQRGSQQSGRIVERPMPVHVSNVAKVTK
jgi:large subunit ribosomal protein L24